MNNQDRNIRTLITCFVIALFVLVPLRFVELQNTITQDVMVLGEETEVYEEEYVEEEYVEEEILEEEIFLDEEIEMVEEEMIEEEVELPNAEFEQ